MKNKRFYNHALLNQFFTIDICNAFRLVENEQNEIIVFPMLLSGIRKALNMHS